LISTDKILKKYAVHPRRRLSQSFLRDDNIARKIVTAMNLRGDDLVLEIGAGHGVLTRLIAPCVREVNAVEIDGQMVAILEQELGDRRNVRIIHADILKLDLEDLAIRHGDFAGARLKVVGNIPYGISTDILFRLLACRQLLSHVVIMVQKEVAERLTARPETKAYGIPTVLLQMHARVAYLFDVAPACFIPSPRVTSAVISLTFREAPLVRLRDEEFFARLVKAAFSRRRKTLWNNIRDVPWMNLEAATLRKVMTACGLAERIRSEAVAVETLGRLSNELLAAGCGWPAPR